MSRWQRVHSFWGSQRWDTQAIQKLIWKWDIQLSVYIYTYYDCLDTVSICWYCLHLYIMCILYTLYNLFARIHCRNWCRKQAKAICTGDCHRTFLMEFLTYCCWQSCGTCTSQCGLPRPMPSHGIFAAVCRCKFIGSTVQQTVVTILQALHL